MIEGVAFDVEKGYNPPPEKGVKPPENPPPAPPPKKYQARR